MSNKNEARRRFLVQSAALIGGATSATLSQQGAAQKLAIANPLSLTNHEVYAVTAYVLALNGIIGEDAVMNAQSLPQVKMPNRDGFVSDWLPRQR